ncbi:MAG: hypothetical protein HY739_15745 [Desulfobacterales bacterium]|nr:hypothetical protein [Desulfobacterales bacterium]
MDIGSSPVTATKRHRIIISIGYEIVPVVMANRFRWRVVLRIDMAKEKIA